MYDSNIYSFAVHQLCHSLLKWGCERFAAARPAIWCEALFGSDWPGALEWSKCFFGTRTSFHDCARRFWNRFNCWIRMEGLRPEPEGFPLISEANVEARMDRQKRMKQFFCWMVFAANCSCVSTGQVKSLHRRGYKQRDLKPTLRSMFKQVFESFHQIPMNNSSVATSCHTLPRQRPPPLCPKDGKWVSCSLTPLIPPRRGVIQGSSNRFARGLETLWLTLCRRKPEEPLTVY